VLTDDELILMRRLTPLVRTPRTAKCLLNVASYHKIFLSLRYGKEHGRYWLQIFFRSANAEAISP
jgi:hypothetical protein